VRLADVIGRFLGKVEIVLAGADEDLREGEEALAESEPMRARAAAHRVLQRAPDSPIGLALLADACEAAGLEAELVLTLEQLARVAPSRAEVWVRLGRARRTAEVKAIAPADPGLGATSLASSSAALTREGTSAVRDAFVRGLAVADAGSEARRDALLGLADLDLAEGEAARAELWLERLATEVSPDVAVRRAEARLLRGDAAGAAKLMEGVTAPLIDGRAALARGRALAALNDPAAFLPLVRAMVLDTPGSSESLSAALAHLPTEAQTRTRIRSVVDAKGEQDLARWRAAFASAEGARDAARRALREAVEGHDATSARPLLDAAIEDRDERALEVAVEALTPTDPVTSDAARMGEALRSMAGGDEAGALDALSAVSSVRVAAWADEVASEAAARWVPASGAPAAWTPIVGRLDVHAHAVGDLRAAARVADLAAERSRPVRLAVVGEFNAGKSTFINALLGADVAPTGVLPTTATLHHLRWALDPIAKILFEPGQDPAERIVALSELRTTLASLASAPVSRVEIRAPLDLLVRAEILDTPGFNAPDPRHAVAAQAAFEEADVALWLLDATQAMKQSERAVLDQAQRAGVPLQVLVNKADRLRPADLEQVMQAVRDALRETGIASWGPPIALSAKRALAGKLGDAPALAESNWGAIEALLEQQIVSRSDELKERALRRRALVIVEDLERAWTRRASAEADAAATARARAADATRAAARIEREYDEVASNLAQSLAPHAQAWSRDVELVFVGRDRASIERDPVLGRYRVERALSIVAPALALALASLAPEAHLSPAQVTPDARSIVRTAALASASRDGLVNAVARASVSAWIERLSALSLQPPPTGRAAGVARELRAFAAVLRRR
jgi:small GTP-binding protein